MPTAMQSPETNPTNDASGAEAPTPAAADERERLERQLRQLERKEAELRRALIVVDHPELSQPILEVDGRVYGLQTATERLESPLTKSEEKKQARLEKKVAGLRAKREALDASIAELEAELSQLGEDRLASLAADREAALKSLFAVMAEHAEAFESAGLKVSSIVPDLQRWLPELRAMAEEREAS